ncbi:MAG: 3'-5' exonuclease [Myxococcota bacterium]
MSWFARRKRAPEGEPAVSRYVGADWKGLLNTNLSEARFVVFDTETSGLDVDQDDVLSLSGVGVEGGGLRVWDHLDLLFLRDDVGGEPSARIHGILPRDLADGRDERSACLAFLDFVKGAVLVGHHVDFDVAVMNRMTMDLFGLELVNPCIDTAHLFNRVTGAAGEVELAPPSLDAMSRRLGVSIASRHSASGDAWATALAFIVLLRRAEKRGLMRVGDIATS